MSFTDWLTFTPYFYYKFLSEDLSGDEQWWSHNFQSHSVEAWMGRAFELLCLCHVGQIKRALGISEMATSVSSWRQLADKANQDPTKREGAQIDLIINRADRMVHLCEMKFSVGPYELKDAYEKKLRQRMTVFREATKCTKALVNTFVTTFGVADGMHKSIVNSEVTLDELFI